MWFPDLIQKVLSQKQSHEKQVTADNDLLFFVLLQLSQKNKIIDEQNTIIKKSSENELQYIKKLVEKYQCLRVKKYQFYRIT